MNTNQHSLIGDAIHSWDIFYQKNYQWIYLAALSQHTSAYIAAQLSDKIFLNILLKHPELVSENNMIKLKQAISVLFPEMAPVLKDQKATAKQLMSDYYSVN